MSKKSQWPKRRAQIRKHLRRSTLLSDGAFRMWDELADGWAWNDPVCFPNYAMISKTTGRHRNTVRKYVDELVDLGLVERLRRPRGYEFRILDELPEEFLDPYIDNTGLREKRRKSKKVVKPEPEVMNNTLCITEPDHVSRCTSPCASDAQDVVHHIGSDAQDVVHRDEQDVVHLTKERKQKERKQEEDRDNWGEREPSVRASKTKGDNFDQPSRSALGNEGTDQSGELLGLEKDSPDDLIEDDLEVTRRFKPRRRTPDPALVSRSRKTKVPFPEAQGSSQIDFPGKSDPGVASPYVETPEDVLALLRGEVEEKWGSRSTRSLPYELEKTAKISRQVNSAVLRKYTPDVVRDMVRVLVWDWEVARGTCFPFRHDVEYPDLLALVQYARELASRIDSGFRYPTSQRGSINTYKDRFIDRLQHVEDDDPF